MATKYPYWSLRQWFYEQGQAEAQAEMDAELLANQRKTLRRVVTARGLQLTGDQDRLIDNCSDLGRIEAWTRAAVTATSLDQVFG